MEKLQKIIDQTTVERLHAIESMKDGGAQAAGSDNFAKLEDRLQALAVLMLHYCAALQVCLYSEGKSFEMEVKT